MGLDITLLASAARQVERVLAAARAAGLRIIHTREGYAPDLSDCPPFKRNRSDPQPGTKGALGRYMIRGEPGHDIAPPFTPLAHETVIDKPGAGAFHATELEAVLRQHDIRQIILCGVTIDCCILATTFEGNDRGFECLVIGDATACYHPATTDAVRTWLSLGVIASLCETDAFVAAIS